jgi:putative N6-adenine-specific DNA methylase
MMQHINPTKKSLTRITCAQHVAPHLRREVEGLGYEVQGEDHVSVQVGATLHECLDLCLRLRTAHHVMWHLTRFRCPSPKALYTHTAAFPWELLIPKDGYLSVTSNVDNPKITNTMYPNLVVKDAIVDRMKRVFGVRPDSGPDRTGVVVHLFWKGDRAWVYLNVNGPRLADRGYRKLPHDAPMRETLAAAVLLAAGYDGTQALVNPMCGSGTLAIEGALIASGRAPGLLRSHYAAMHTALELEQAWKDARKRAKGLARAAGTPPIVASDHDPRAIEAAKKNALTAGVDHMIEFAECDFAETPMPEGVGQVILNPEYGLRLGETEELGATYARIGDFFKQRCRGWTGHVFTGSRELSKRIGLRSTRRQAFMNAQIECRLLSYEVYEAGGVGSSFDARGDAGGGAV